MTNSFCARFGVLYLFALVTVSGGCASSKDYSKVPTADLFVEVQEVQKKIDAKQVPVFKETGAPEIDLIVKPYVDAATENAPKALALVAECNNSQIVQLVNKSVDAELKKQGKSNPTDEERNEIIITVLSALTPEERAQWDQWVDSNRNKLDAEATTSSNLVKMGLAAAKSLGEKLLAVSKGGDLGATYAASETAAPIKDGIAQVEAVQKFTAPADELIKRFSAQLDAHDKMAKGNAAGGN